MVRIRHPSSVKIAPGPILTDDGWRTTDDGLGVNGLSYFLSERFWLKRTTDDWSGRRMVWRTGVNGALLSIDQVASPRLSGNDYPMLVQCWVNVVDPGPTLIQHWVKVWSMPQAMRNISIFKQPDKHLIWQNWFGVGPASKTMGQHRTYNEFVGKHMVLAYAAPHIARQIKPTDSSFLLHKITHRSQNRFVIRFASVCMPETNAVNW